MEYCDNTLDSYILNNNDNISNNEWFAILMQIIMTLLTYQKLFNFTHNDLHTNNIMYINTDKLFIYYCYKNIYYKVPTYGKIFKIIDFGRSIFKVNDKLFCSDSFDKDGDASTQYNFPPFFDSKKKLLEPNKSFDLCRLACSIFDFIFDDISDIHKEVDEFQHQRTTYEPECERIRMINISQSLGQSTLFIRFNPDSYKFHGRSIDNIRPSHRLKSFGAVLQKYFHMLPENVSSMIGICACIYLYFDGFDDAEEYLPTILLPMEQS
jgi:hypothetical protein